MSDSHCDDGGLSRSKRLLKADRGFIVQGGGEHAIWAMKKLSTSFRAMVTFKEAVFGFHVRRTLWRIGKHVSISARRYQSDVACTIQQYF
jgi:hypothetical protein